MPAHQGVACLPAVSLAQFCVAAALPDVDLHFWDAPDDIVGATMDLLFERDRVYLHKANGSFGAIPLSVSGEDSCCLHPSRQHLRGGAAHTAVRGGACALWRCMCCNASVDAAARCLVCHTPTTHSAVLCYCGQHINTNSLSAQAAAPSTASPNGCCLPSPPPPAPAPPCLPLRRP